MVTGGRVIFSINTVGGVLKDLTPEHAKAILETIADIEQEVKVIQKTFFEDYSVLSRLKGVGVMTKEQINSLGSVGPFARASGVKADMRLLGYAAYGKIDFEPITSEDGDSYARCYVRLMEIYQSIDIIRQAIAKMPSETDLITPVKGNPTGEAFVRLEQPRGEAFYYAKANGTPNLERMRVRTPTFANILGLCEMLKNTELSDIGLLILTIDPCISCTER